MIGRGADTGRSDLAPECGGLLAVSRGLGHLFADDLARCAQEDGAYLLLADADPVIIMSTGAVTQTVPKNRIKEKKPLGRSLMLSAEQMGLDAQGLADLAAFLRTK